jgi:hypothetical protein
MDLQNHLYKLYRYKFLLILRHYFSKIFDCMIKRSHHIPACRQVRETEVNGGLQRLPVAARPLTTLLSAKKKTTLYS